MTDCSCVCSHDNKVGNKCKPCKITARRHAVKLRAVEYLGGKCQRCGYDKCKGALDFHHRDEKTKEFTIGSNECRAWKKIKEELDKCVLICANYHREEDCNNPHCGSHLSVFV